MTKMAAFGEVKQTEKKTPAFGIDLGTTNSCIAICEGVNSPRIIRLNNNAITMPSCVMWKGKAGKFIVGKEAYENRYKPNAIYSVKRLMGSEENVSLEYGGKTLEMSPIEVSAEILKALVEQARTLYKDITDVTITVPAYFNHKQVEDTLEAGRLAGLNVLNITREPTAASMVYQMPEGVNSELVLVYDLGGGTFDVSLVRITRQGEMDEMAALYGIPSESDNSGDTSRSLLYTVMDTDGDSRLGGDDIDRAMFDILSRKLSDMGVDMSKVAKPDKEQLILQLERLKKMGAGTYEIPIDLKLKAPRGKNKFKGKVFINMADFIEATSIVYRKTKSIVQSILARAGDVKISSIALVGGSTKSDILRKMLENDFPEVRLNFALNPDESVALGASIKAKEVKFGDTNTEVFDVIPLLIGVYGDGRVNTLIKRGQRVPYQVTEVFQTVVDNQESVSVPVYEGLSALREECQYLGNVVVNDLPRKPAGEVGVYVTLSLDTNGLLSILVRTDGGKQVKAELINLFGMKKSQEQEIEQPKRDRKVVKWMNLAERLEGANRVWLLDVVRKYEAGTASIEDVEKVISKVVAVDTSIERTAEVVDTSDNIR